MKEPSTSTVERNPSGSVPSKVSTTASMMKTFLSRPEIESRPSIHTLYVNKPGTRVGGNNVSGRNETAEVNHSITVRETGRDKLDETIESIVTLSDSDRTDDPNSFNRRNSSSNNNLKNNSGNGSGNSMKNAYNGERLGSLLGIANPNFSQNVMLSIIEDPIQCGYLFAFCELEHSTENLGFIMEVIRYREKLSSDSTTWTKTWQELDQIEKEKSNSGSNLMMDARARARSRSNSTSSLSTVVTTSNSNASNGHDHSSHYNNNHNNNNNNNNYASDAVWPSKKLQQSAVQEQLQYIWNKYLQHDADNQICISADVLARTERRMKQVHCYGPEVFGEALLDPINTLQRDSLPRFLNSDYCNEMVMRLNSLRQHQQKQQQSQQLLAPANMLVVPPPSPSYSPLLLSQPIEYFHDNRQFSLQDILSNYLLYNDFLEYLKKSVSSENLLCVRMIQIFEEKFVNSNDSNRSNNSGNAINNNVNNNSVISSRNSSSKNGNNINSSSINMLSAGYSNGPSSPQTIASTVLDNSIYSNNNNNTIANNNNDDVDIEIVDLAWTIYQYFVSSGSPFEVSLYSLHKKEIMLSLAKPKLNTFDALKKSALSMLAVTYNSYRFTEDYRSLPKLMRLEKKKPPPRPSATSSGTSAGGGGVGGGLHGLTHSLSTSISTTFSANLSTASSPNLTNNNNNNNSNNNNSNDNSNASSSNNNNNRVGPRLSFGSLIWKQSSSSNLLR